MKNMVMTRQILNTIVKLALTKSADIFKLISNRVCLPL